jgi:hypothetical protein
MDTLSEYDFSSWIYLFDKQDVLSIISGTGLIRGPTPFIRETNVGPGELHLLMELFLKLLLTNLIWVGPKSALIAAILNCTAKC